MPAPPCSICEQVAGRIAAPGGSIYDDGLWLVTHHTGPHTDPGELIVKLRRHCESLGELTAAEAMALARPGRRPHPRGRRMETVETLIAG